jgi:hypothetical protein
MRLASLGAAGDECESYSRVCGPDTYKNSAQSGPLHTSGRNLFRIRGVLAAMTWCSGEGAPHPRTHM